MDFIKTSSLRALIELTFQRNWNGLIWMSRKGVITKRVKTVQTALSRISAQPRSPAGRETMFRARPKFRPSEVSAKVPNRPADHATTRETCPAVGQAHNATPRRARPCARAGEQASRPRNPLRTTADASVRAGKERPTSGREFHRPNLIRRPRRPTVNPSGPDRSDSATPDVRPIVPTTVPTPRSTRSPF
ncbi:unnamed protein product [Microthlaspi erraticum]|uniref:Uncharacterized protein n=1 Tax=Microthlaspi erraticum TaxID=1685480 RepID=A0A6D2K4B8_9BRAS|nr:unnamed protein product [Microthlaspi erraticum]